MFSGDMAHPTLDADMIIVALGQIHAIGRDKDLNATDATAGFSAIAMPCKARYK
jgi:hypothetical protein